MNKKNLILGVILILLVAFAYLYQGPFREWRSSLGRPDNILASVDIDQINKIEIDRAGKTTILEKIDERWKINGTKSFYVNDSVMDSVFSVLKDSVNAAVELVSENIDKKPDFQTDNSGTLVKLSQGDTEQISFMVGKVGNDYSSTYISLPDSNKTFLVKVNLNSAIVRSDWYDKTIFSSEKEKIDKIRFQYPTREFTIAKKDDTWSGVLPYYFEVSGEKAEEVLILMSSMAAVEIPEQNFENTGLEKNSIIIEATGEGVNNTVMIGDSNEDGFYYAKTGSNDNIYLITEEDRNILNKQIGDLR